MANKFKVGDRVRVLVKTGLRMYDVGTTCDVIDVYDDGVLLNSNGRGNLFYDFCDLEPIAVADSNSNEIGLRIEAGKYYKTRDGRKVGPMQSDDSFGEPAFIEEDGDGRGWSLSGKAIGWDQGDNEDLIAEWVDALVDLSAIRDDIKEYLEFLKPKSPAIVARIDNGQPKPATRPYVHPNRASAEKEAARLAKANPGREFGVYEFVSSASEPYKHEWQRLAATTKPAPWVEDPAVSSLISLTGMSEKSATLAVGQFRREAA